LLLIIEHVFIFKRLIVVIPLLHPISGCEGKCRSN